MCHIKHSSEVIASHLQLWALCITISNKQLFHLTATKSLDIFIKRHCAIHVNYFIEETEVVVEEELNMVLKGRSYN